MSGHAGTMRKRPRSITIIAWLLIGAGTIGLVYHATEFKTERPFAYDVIWVGIVRLLAIISGIFMLRGSNWARWLLLVWLAYHVILSTFHSLFELAVHSLLLAVIAYFLFRPQASAYFLSANTPR